MEARQKSWTMHRTRERTQMRNRRSQTETEERVNEPLPLPHWSTASPQLGLPRALSSTQTRAPATSRRNTRTHIAKPRNRLLASVRTEQRVPTDASTTPCRHSRHRQTPKEDWADAHSAPRDARPCALENVRGRPLRHLHAMRHECARMGAAGGTTVATRPEGRRDMRGCACAAPKASRNDQPSWRAPIALGRIG
jgi:hypothetical protein